MAFKEAMIAASPALLGLAAQIEGRNPNGLSVGLAAMAANTEEQKRKAAIAGLMGQMGIGDTKRALLDTMPLAAQQSYMLQMMQQREEEAKKRREDEAQRNLWNRITGGGTTSGPGMSEEDMIARAAMEAIDRPYHKQERNPYADAIASVESAGSGDYGAVGPQTSKGRAYGRYQVMDFNVGPWTKKHYGQELTPDEFLRTPAAQDAVFNGEFGSYVQKYGNPQDAASVWFSGRPMAEAGNASDGYNTVPEYVNKFNNALGDKGTPYKRYKAALNKALSMPPDMVPKGLVERLERLVEFHAPEDPADEYGRYVREERAAGREPLSRIDYAQAKKGTETVYGPDGKPILQRGPASGNLPKTTEGEKAASGYLSRMRASEKILTDLAEDGTESRGIASLLASGTNFEGLVLSNEQQKLLQAQRDWVRAKLRKESGAVIGTDEMAEEIRTYFPLPGEGPEVIAQKAASRKQAERQFEIMAGNAADQAGGETGFTLSPEAQGVYDKYPD